MVDGATGSVARVPNVVVAGLGSREVFRVIQPMTPANAIDSVASETTGQLKPYLEPIRSRAAWTSLNPFAADLTASPKLPTPSVP